MYELWAKKRPVNGKGFPYEFIMEFSNVDYSYTALDKLDRDIYQEALVVVGDRCILSVEWDKEEKAIKK